MNADQLLSVNIAMAEYNATRKEEFHSPRALWKHCFGMVREYLQHI